MPRSPTPCAPARKNTALVSRTLSLTTQLLSNAVVRCSRSDKKARQFPDEKNKIEVIEGTAKPAGAGKINVELTAGGQEEVRQKIYPGNRRARHRHPGMEPDGEKILDFSQAIMQENSQIRHRDRRWRVIGVEFATVWSGYGVDVSIVEMLPHILPNEDEEAANNLPKPSKAWRQSLWRHKVKSITKTENGTSVLVEGEKGEETLEAEITLVAIGFRPNSKGIGLEEAGVEVDKRGFVVIDDRMATTAPGVWAIGDLTGKLLLAHAASAMGVIAAENIAGREERKLDYRMIAPLPDPQVASFGYTEAQAKEAGFAVKTGRQLHGERWALGLGAGTGFAKVVIDEDTVSC